MILPRLLGFVPQSTAANYSTVTRSERAGDNRYEITVRATEQVTEGADVRALSTETNVTVRVTDENEDGSGHVEPHPARGRLSNNGHSERPRRRFRRCRW